jgi:hypothetical protein
MERPRTTAMELTDKAGTVIATGYERVVWGGRGAYVECTDSQVLWRNFSPTSCRSMYYTIWKSNDPLQMECYCQLAEVKYADYKVGMNYMALHDVVGLPPEAYEFQWK